MNKQQFLILIDKFLAGKTSSEENKLLLNYYESFQETNEWSEVLESKEMLKERMLKRLKISLSEGNQENKKQKRFTQGFILKYAAVFVGIIGALYFYTNKGVFSESFSDKNIETNTITLKLNNGIVDVISENEQRKIFDGKGNVIGVQNGNQLNYNQSKNALKKLVYNELSVPYGKRFDLVLSDGTMVKLNAGTSIKYPIQFIEGEDRNVYVNGEAYFEVAKDKNHPFVVNSKNLNIRVLGTRFNVSSYEEDENVNTVLVEGAVRLYASDEAYSLDGSAVLEPDHKASWNKRDRQISFEKVDAEVYTAWMKGKLVFENMPFKKIRKKLERHYNVSIINNNKTLDERLYNASFDVETIEQVLRSFSENYTIEFTIVGNQIAIN